VNESQRTGRKEMGALLRLLPVTWRRRSDDASGWPQELEDEVWALVRARPEADARHCLLPYTRCCNNSCPLSNCLIVKVLLVYTRASFIRLIDFKQGCEGRQLWFPDTIACTAWCLHHLKLNNTHYMQ